MNFIIPLAVIGFIGWRYVQFKLTETKPYHPKHYVLFDIPAFNIPVKPGDTIDSIRDRYIPTATLIWEIPPKIRITIKWPISYSKDFGLSSNSTNEQAKAAVRGIWDSIQKTSIRKIRVGNKDYWKIDIPPLKIPTLQELRGEK